METFRVVESSVRLKAVHQRRLSGPGPRSPDYHTLLTASCAPDQSRRMRDDLQENLGRFRWGPCPCCIKHVLQCSRGSVSTWLYANLHCKNTDDLVLLPSLLSLDSPASPPSQLSDVASRQTRAMTESIAPQAQALGADHQGAD